MVSKLKTFIVRLKNGSFKRMFNYIDRIKEDYGVPRFITFIDMCWCILFYGIGYLEYRVYGFAKVKGRKKRSTFMNMTKNKEIIASFNDKEKADLFFEDKAGFLAKFDKYCRRRWIDLRYATKEELNDFLDATEVIFAKPLDDYGGHGIEKLRSKEIDRETAFENFVSKKQFLLEEGITQHPEMDRLNDTSINTLRMVTILGKDGNVHWLYTIFRMGRANSVVDNITSGGLYTRVDENGIPYATAFCDNTGEYYTAHPDSAVEFSSFRIPMYREAVEMCLEAARNVPEVRYVGWDVAITPDGPCFVEGNPMPSYDMVQNYAFQEEDHTGLKTLFDKYI